MLKILVIVCLHYYVCGQVSTVAWTYGSDNEGPDHWPSLHKTCGGPWQSPINIMDKVATKVKNDNPLKIELGEGKSLSTYTYNVKNNGHSIQITFPGDLYFAVFGNNKREVKQLHFHWGSTDSQGSEHTLNGKHYPLEMHVVCFDKELYTTFEEAAAHPFGLTVLGFFGEIRQPASSAEKPLFDRLGDFEKKIASVTPANTDLNMDAFDLKELLSGDMLEFYRYPGSLTTPPCTSNVAWHVFPSTIPITTENMQMFRTLQTTSGATLHDNFRPVQMLTTAKDLLPRVVYHFTNNIEKESEKMGNAVHMMVPFSGLSLFICVLTQAQF